MGKITKADILVLENIQLAEGIYSMWLEAPQIAREAVPGQFVSVYCKDAGKLLPRPISLCEIDAALGRIRLVYRVAGAGTKELSKCMPGEKIAVMGPLGNGYFTEKMSPDKHALLFGGGIGIPPLLALTAALKCKKTAVLGYRDSQTFLKEEFEACGCKVLVATDNGSIGVKGNVIDAAKEHGLKGSMAFSCGPLPMQRGVKSYMQEIGIPTQLSLEERMACGVGACLACVCQSKEVDEHSNVRNKRVCKDGPVFWAEEIEL